MKGIKVCLDWLYENPMKVLTCTSSKSWNDVRFNPNKGLEMNTSYRGWDDHHFNGKFAVDEWEEKEV